MRPSGSASRPLVAHRENALLLLAADSRYTPRRPTAGATDWTLRPWTAMVALAQPAEQRIVDPQVTGSTPVGHPNSLPRIDAESHAECPVVALGRPAGFASCGKAVVRSRRFTRPGLRSPHRRPADCITSWLPRRPSPDAS